MRALLLVLLLAAPAGAQERGLTRCLWPGSCSTTSWQRTLFPLAFRPIRGCRPAGRTWFRSPHHRPYVALTFDDGPSVWTPRLLRQLRRLQVPASFFVIGQQAQQHPRLLARMRAQGHLLGNHSWSHPWMPKLSGEEQRRQLRDTQHSIAGSGYRPCLMRPPYGGWNPQLRRQARRAGMDLMLWDVDTGDWSRPGSQVIRQRARAARGGSVILLHDGGGDRRQTLTALPGIVRDLRRRGLQPVRLDRLLGLRTLR